MQNLNKIGRVVSEIQAKRQIGPRSIIVPKSMIEILKASMGPGNNKHAKFEQIRMSSF